MAGDVSADILIIGSGIGGATLAAALAPTGARILILERGTPLRDCPEARDDAAIFRRGFFAPKEEWLSADGTPFLANNHYHVGGNSKFFGAVMLRYRAEDFLPRPHPGGASPGWPLSYAEMEPWYARAEALFRVRGSLGEDPTEPPHATPYPFPPVPDEPAIARLRARLARAGAHPASLPLAIDIEEWLRGGQTGWDAFPNTGRGKIDAEVGPLAAALAHPNVTLLTGARVTRLETDSTGRRVTAALASVGGTEKRFTAGRFAVACGAVQTAALLLRSAGAAHPAGLANGSGQLGRNFMNHNTTAMIAIDPWVTNTSVYQKTLGVNDFYHGDAEHPLPLGNLQLLGRITANILKANVPALPMPLARLIARHAYGWFLTSEDLPDPSSRVLLRDGRIVIDWQRSNLQTHDLLVARVRRLMRRAGFPLVLTRGFGRGTTSHQCGTARLGADPAASVVDTALRAHDLANLWITDASVLPTSAAVNPALTIAALALKAGAAIGRELGAGDG